MECTVSVLGTNLGIFLYIISKSVILLGNIKAKLGQSRPHLA